MIAVDSFRSLSNKRNSHCFKCVEATQERLCVSAERENTLKDSAGLLFPTKCLPHYKKAVFY